MKLNLLILSSASLIFSAQDLFLFTAIRQNKPLELQTLLLKNANPNSRLIDGTTPLHMASSKNFTNVMAILIQNNANINAQDNLGSTPLHVAIKEKNDNAVKLLLDSGATLEITDKRGKTPMVYAEDAFSKTLDKDLKKAKPKLGKSIQDFISIPLTPPRSRNNEYISLLDLSSEIEESSPKKKRCRCCWP